MDRKKMEKLEKRGWRAGDAADFLGLSKNESEYIELRVALTQALHKERTTKHLSQEELARLIHSSQSRVAKMEKNDPSVSVDLIIRSLFALGVSKERLAETIA